MSDDITQSVAGEVRAELARKRISQRELGAALGLSQAAAWRRLRGDVAFDVAELERVATLLSVPIERFIPSRRRAAART